MDTNKLIKAIFGELLKEIKTNQVLKENIRQLIEERIKSPNGKPGRAHRRQRGSFDPMEAYRRQPETLQRRLEDLDIEQLKDIIAEHGMDKAKLAMKWKTKDRLIKLIFTTVESRSHKGDAFR